LKPFLLLPLLAALLAAQPAPHRFAHLTLSGNAAKTATGSLPIDPTATPRRAGAIDFFAGDGTPLLIGASSSASPLDLWVALPVPSAPPALSGNYAGGLLQFRHGDATAVISAYVEFTASSPDTLSNVSVTGHAAFIDDVNRRFTAESVSYQMDPNGAGTLGFPDSLGFLAGKRALFVSPNGDVIISTPAAPDAGLLIAVRRAPDTSTISFNGLFHLVELNAATTFQFNPSATRFSAASGYLKADGGGNAYISERLRSPNGPSFLSANNSYLLGFTGAGVLSPRPQPQILNFGITPRPMIFAGAAIGAVGELTLSHGLFVGLQVAEPPPVSTPSLDPRGVTLLSTTPTAPGGPLSPGALISLSGMQLAPKSETALSLTAPPSQPVKLPLELAGVSLTLNSLPCPLLSVSDSQIIAQIPLSAKPGPATLRLRSATRELNPIDVFLTPAAPAVLLPPPPARRGQPFTLLLHGVPANLPFQLYLDGQPVAAPTLTPFPHFPGVTQLQFTLPPDAPIRPLPLSIHSAATFSDLLDLTPQP
jgi:hypothetical protein